MLQNSAWKTAKHTFMTFSCKESVDLSRSNPYTASLVYLVFTLFSELNRETHVSAQQACSQTPSWLP